MAKAAKKPPPPVIQYIEVQVRRYHTLRIEPWEVGVPVGTPMTEVRALVGVVGTIYSMGRVAK